jgi:serine/threonine protein phosphatase 1
MRDFDLTYCIGDVHGCHSLLRELLGLIRDDANGQAHRLVFLGDLIDRGVDSAGVVRTVRDIQADRPEEVVCLKGNHEEMLLQVIDGTAAASWWTANGGDATLKAYGVRRASRLPSDVVAWMRALPTSYEDPLRVFVHAGLQPGIALDRQDDDTKLWMREPFLSSEYDFGKHVVHGHTPVPSGQPDHRSWRTNLDTGAVYGGPLTAAVFTDEQAGPVDIIQVKRTRS